MATTPVEDSGPPKLLVSAGAATCELDAQVANGEALRPRLTDATSVGEAKRALQAWTDAAADVIEQVFTGRAYWADFQHVTTPFDDGVIRPRGARGGGDRDTTDAVVAKLDERLRVLRDLVDRARRLGRFAADRGTLAQAASKTEQERQTVFVVHGRDVAARAALASFLRALKLDPMEWEQAVTLTGKGTPTIWEVVQTGIQSSGAVVVLLTGDDEARLRVHLLSDGASVEELSPQPRPNVLLEMGMALMNARERTVLLRVGDLRRVTDIDGMHVLPFDNSPERRKDIVQRLRTAGCDPADEGKDWMSAGEVPVPTPGGAERSPPSSAATSVRCEAVARLRLDHPGFRNKLSVAIRLIGAAALPDFKVESLKIAVRWYGGPVGSGTKYFDASHFPERHGDEVAIRKDWVLTDTDLQALKALSPCASVNLQGAIRTSYGVLPCNLGPIALAPGHVWNSIDTDDP